MNYNSRYQSGPLWSTVGGRPSLVIGPTANGADYGPFNASDGANGFTDALAALAVGGTIRVLAGTYNFTSPIIVSKSCRIICDAGALFQVQNNVTSLQAKIVSGGSQIWSFIVAIGAGQVTWRGGQFNSLFTTNGSMSAMCVATGARIDIVDVYLTNFTRWGIYATGHYEYGSTVFDGAVTGLHVVRPHGDNLGNTTTPDGGPFKLDYLGTANAANMTGIYLIEGYFTNCNMFGADVHMTNAALTTHRGLHILDCEFWASATAPAGSTAVFLESAVVIQTVKVRGCYANAFGNGYQFSPVNIDVDVSNNTAEVSQGTGFLVSTIAAAVAAGYNWRISGNTALGGVVGYAVALSAASAGSTFSRVVITSNVANDAGHATLTTGLRLTNGANKAFTNAVISNNDLSGVTATPLDLTAFTIASDIEVYIVNNEGVNPQGFATTTPAIGATGADVQNFNPYPVMVRILTTGSGVTAYGVTDRAGTLKTFATAVPVGYNIRVEAYGKVRLSYTGTPTWVWEGL